MFEWRWLALENNVVIGSFYVNGSVKTSKLQNFGIRSCINGPASATVSKSNRVVWVNYGFHYRTILFESITLKTPCNCSITQNYREMLKHPVIPEIQQRQCLDSIIFMQDRDHIFTGQHSVYYANILSISGFPLVIFSMSVSIAGHYSIKSSLRYSKLSCMWVASQLNSLKITSRVIMKIHSDSSRSAIEYIIHQICCTQERTAYWK